MDQIVSALKREEERLSAELAQNATFRRLTKVRDLLAEYTGHVGPEREWSAPSFPVSQRGSVSVARRRSKSADVEDAVVAFLTERGRRATSGELLPAMQNAGIKIGGRVPSKTMASFLSNSKRFNNIKGFGYGLVEWGTSPGPKATASEHMSFFGVSPEENAPPDEGGADTGEVHASPLSNPVPAGTH